MQDIWYGDKRDLIKWGTLVYLARRHRIRTIIQVAFLQLSDRPSLESDGRKLPVADEVWLHFKNLLSIQSLGRRCRLTIRVLAASFDHKKRDRYLRDVVAAFEADKKRKVVLLDPDTGIEPRKRTQSHVGLDEITEVWRSLSPGDWLVLYQHQRRRRGWQGQVRKEFARACEAARVRVFVSALASDVAFFAAAKRRGS